MLVCRLADVYLVVDEILRWDPHRAGARDPLEPAAKAVLGRSVTGMLTRWVVVTRSASVDRRSTGGAVPCQELLKSENVCPREGRPQNRAKLGVFWGVVGDQ